MQIMILVLVQCEIVNDSNSCIYQLTVDRVINGASIRQYQYSDASLIKCAKFLIKFFDDCWVQKDTC